MDFSGAVITTISLVDYSVVQTTIIIVVEVVCLGILTTITVQTITIVVVLAQTI